MYDFYPEWGPARNRDEDDLQPVVRKPRYWVPADHQAKVPAMAGAGAPEARDGESQRPDDN